MSKQTLGGLLLLVLASGCGPRLKGEANAPGASAAPAGDAAPAAPAAN